MDYDDQEPPDYDYRDKTIAYLQGELDKARAVANPPELLAAMNELHAACQQATRSPTLAIMFPEIIRALRKVDAQCEGTD